MPLAPLFNSRHTFEVFKNFVTAQMTLKTGQELFTSPRESCQTIARFSNNIKLSIGSFVREDQLVTFKKSQHFENVPAELPLSCLAEVGPKKAEYFVGKIGEKLTSTDRDTFLTLALSLSKMPVPSRLRYLFGYRKKLDEWRYLSACPVFYELTSGLTQIYNRLMKSGAKLAASPGKYFDITEDYLETLDLRKRNAGAARLLERNYLQISNSAPRHERFNFSPTAFHSDISSVFFLPDALVVSYGIQNVYYRYEDIRLHTFENRFITHEVPFGVKPVDYTWQYVNKDGGPDRRFNDNFQIPIIEVTELDFYFSDGVQIHTAFTDGRAVENFEAALVELGART